jgi:hypothetical protein
MREQLPNGSSMEDQRTSTDFHLDKIIAHNLAYLTDITDSIQRCSSNNKSISFTRVAPTYKKEAHLLRDYHSILGDKTVMEMVTKCYTQQQCYSCISNMSV